MLDEQIFGDEIAQACRAGDVEVLSRLLGSLVGVEYTLL